jgi:hypothetical protein
MQPPQCYRSHIDTCDRPIDSHLGFIGMRVFSVGPFASAICQNARKRE